MKFICLLSLLVLPFGLANAQGTVPTFQHSYTFPGRDPGQGGKTTIPTVLVPVTLSFESKIVAGKPFEMNAGPDVSSILHSPVFSRVDFPAGGKTQFVDAMLRTTFPDAKKWHTLLGKPEIKPVTISVPSGYGYVLTSKKSGSALAVVDVEFIQRELFKQVSKQDGKFVLAVTHNTTYYAYGDATICCSWGTHGVDAATGNSFVLGSFLRNAPAIVQDRDIQPLTQQLAEFVNDPLHDPLFHPVFHGSPAPGNIVPAWLRPGNKGCGGTGIASMYFLLEPTNTNSRNDVPTSSAFVAHGYHVQNVALMPWYTGSTEGLGHVYSFPDAQALPGAAKPCPARGPLPNPHVNPTPIEPAVASVPVSGHSNGHWLIGYWTGHGIGGSVFPLREVSPQWDVIIVAFASPDKNGPEGALQFKIPSGLDAAQIKNDIAYLKGQGRKVMISLGGGGEYFKLDDPKHISDFVSSVSSIVSEYGFDGVDIDFETPSLVLDPGDKDFRHPITPSVVNLIAGLRQLHDHFGPGFMISLVPEGPQFPAGFPSYGGQFGSYLPIAYGLWDILSFVDAQDYNTPPLQGLDGEIYQTGGVDYHAAMTELLLHGFPVGGDPKQVFPPLPANKVAVGFLVGETTPAIVSQAMDYIITGKAPVGVSYKLQNPAGYPGMIGAMFWTIDGDRRENYSFSNVVGPQLHGY